LLCGGFPRSIDFMVALLLKIAAVALVIGLVLHFLRRPSNLRIVVRNGLVAVDGPVLLARRGQVADFFAENLGDVRFARVAGFWDGRRLQLSCRGDLSRGQQQRLRNYLLTIL
jgi:hypothetical protein